MIRFIGLFHYTFSVRFIVDTQYFSCLLSYLLRNLKWTWCLKINLTVTRITYFTIFIKYLFNAPGIYWRIYQRRIINPSILEKHDFAINTNQHIVAHSGSNKKPFTDFRYKGRCESRGNKFSAASSCERGNRGSRDNCRLAFWRQKKKRNTSEAYNAHKYI